MGWSAGTFTRTNGVFSGATVWFSDAAASVKIVTDRHDYHDQDIATGINTCLTKDGQNTPTANLPMGGFKHTNVGSAAARTDYAYSAQVADGAYSWCGTATGTTGTAYAISNTFAGTSLTLGMRYQFIAPVANTGTTYVTLSGAGSALLAPSDGTSALPAGGVGSNEVVDIQYTNVAGGLWQKMNARTTSSTFTTISVSGGGTLSGTYAGNPTFSGTVNVSGSGFVGTLGANTASISGSANVGTIGGTRAAISGSASVGTLGVSGSASVSGNLSVTGSASVGTLSGTVAGNPVFSGTVALGTASTVPTAAVNDSSTKIANTAFVNPAGTLAASGYQKLASGLIIQWGTGDTTAVNPQAITFPVAFTTAVYSVTATVNQGDGKRSACTQGATTAGFNCYTGEGGVGNQALLFNWMAVGV